MCNNSETDEYLRMVTNPNLVEPEAEMPLKLFKEEDAITEPISPYEADHLLQ